MRVLVAGGTGVIGRELVPLLTAAGHEVSVLTRGDARQVEWLTARAARPVHGDLLDADAVRRAVQQVGPEAVVHMATAIPAEIDPKRQAAQFERTNALRTGGLRNLIAAAEGARLIVQGVAFAYVPGDGLADEDVALWIDAAGQFRPVVGAVAEMESLTAAAGGVVLRFGHLYGPGTFYAADGSFTAQVRGGKVPLVGGGTSVFSFLHARDAATSVAAALASSATGALNVIDDDPAAMAEWLPVFAGVVGAKPPKRIPTWLARLAVGASGAAFMTKLRGADNARAKAELGWRPTVASWRTGFADELGPDRP